MVDDDDFQIGAGYYEYDADVGWHRGDSSSEVQWNKTYHRTDWAILTKSSNHYSSIRGEYIAPAWCGYGDTTDYVSTHDGTVVRGRNDRKYRIGRARGTYAKYLSKDYNIWYSGVSAYRILLYNE